MSRWTVEVSTSYTIEADSADEAEEIATRLIETTDPVEFDVFAGPALEREAS